VCDICSIFGGDAIKLKKSDILNEEAQKLTYTMKRLKSNIGILKMVHIELKVVIERPALI